MVLSILVSLYMSMHTYKYIFIQAKGENLKHTIVPLLFYFPGKPIVDVTFLVYRRFFLWKKLVKMWILFQFSLYQMDAHIFKSIFFIRMFVEKETRSFSNACYYCHAKTSFDHRISDVRNINV